MGSVGSRAWTEIRGPSEILFAAIHERPKLAYRQIDGGADFPWRALLVQFLQRRPKQLERSIETSANHTHPL